MKKSLVLVAAALIMTCSVFAQHVNFGVKAGYNSASVKVEDGVDYDSKSGIHFGGLAHIHITKQFAVQPELVFSCQGGEDDEETKLKLNYLNVPVLAQYMINNGFRLQTGPQFGFLVSAKQKFGDITVDVDDVIKSFDLSWVFGAGYVFTSGFGVDARFNLGLTDISEDNDFEARNRVFQLGVFYQFRGGGGRHK